MDLAIDGIRISEAPRNLMGGCNDISSKWYKHNQYSDEHHEAILHPSYIKSESLPGTRI